MMVKLINPKISVNTDKEIMEFDKKIREKYPDCGWNYSYETDKLTIELIIEDRPGQRPEVDDSFLEQFGKLVIVEDESQSTEF